MYSKSEIKRIFESDHSLKLALTQWLAISRSVGPWTPVMIFEAGFMAALSFRKVITDADCTVNSVIMGWTITAGTQV